MVYSEKKPCLVAQYDKVVPVFPKIIWLKLAGSG